MQERIDFMNDKRGGNALIDAVQESEQEISSGKPAPKYKGKVTYPGFASKHQYQFPWKFLKI